MTYTHHALARARQRGIPPLIEQWLDAYGQEDYDGNGARRVFFSKASIRRMERDFGRAPVQKLSEWLESTRLRIPQADGSSRSDTGIVT